jgi:hypothetical protein
MSEPHLDGQVEAFFDTFAAASDQLDTDRLAELFAETFLAADPAGVQAVPRQAFLHALPRRAELFAAAGITASPSPTSSISPWTTLTCWPGPTGAPNVQVLGPRSGCPRRSSCAATRTGCRWCSTSTTRT